MEKYHVYYDSILIGELICDEERYQYRVNHEQIKELIEKGEPIVPTLMEEQIEFGPVIPYFQVKIQNAERFSGLEIGNLTDKVRLKKI